MSGTLYLLLISLTLLFFLNYSSNNSDGLFRKKVAIMITIISYLVYHASCKAVWVVNISVLLFPEQHPTTYSSNKQI